MVELTQSSHKSLREILARQSGVVWIETTKTSHQHGGPGWEFGTCLWSPSSNKKGHDTYSTMKMAKKGDAVLHFLESIGAKSILENRLCAISTIGAGCSEISEGPPLAGEWSDRSSYFKIDLDNFVELSPALSIADFILCYENELRAELSEDHPKYYPFAATSRGVRLNQGAYLTRASPRLLKLIADAYGIESGEQAFVSSVEAHASYSEGQRLRRETYFFSRNSRLVKEVKKKYKYRCVACGFDFYSKYGELGKNYIECHHLNPLSERAESEWSADLGTNIDGVVVLCANCHRMVHRRRPALSLEELISAVQSYQT